MFVYWGNNIQCNLLDSRSYQKPEVGQVDYAADAAQSTLSLYLFRFSSPVVMYTHYKKDMEWDKQVLEGYTYRTDFRSSNRNVAEVYALTLILYSVSTYLPLSTIHRLKDSKMWINELVNKVVIVQISSPNWITTLMMTHILVSLWLEQCAVRKLCGQIIGHAMRKNINTVRLTARLKRVVGNYFFNTDRKFWFVV